jgi:hypothetical protein
MTDEELIAMFRATGDYQNAAIADRIAALRARVAELESELAAIRREAETNQKWAFLEWRDRAERAKADNARLRENSHDLWTATTALLAWVDAVPSEALRGETLPGIDLGWVNEVVARTALTAKEPK